MKVNYGIYLGTNSASIARMKNGVPVILKSNVLKDAIPLCVAISKNGSILVGDTAYNLHKRELLKSQQDWGCADTNLFVEFIRTLGTDKTYFSNNANKSFTSTELVAEVIKILRYFVKDEEVKSAVITVPAGYRINQIDAVREAGKLAGLLQVEIVQEPIAAAMSYRNDSDKKDGFCLVFDFGVGTFDVALLKVEEGIIQIIDTVGDNFLGSKNLDFAIVDEIILPYIQNNYVIDSILADDSKKQYLRNSLKYYAEETKISFNDTHNILSDISDILGEDDEGEEFELDITVTQEDITRALAPIFQKAIDVSQSLLKRNNLKGNSLDALILVGGPTLSPIVRGMLEAQICKPDTSVNPMTVVATGAALYASTVDVSEEVREQTRDTAKIQLEIAHESSTVEMEEYVPIKILADKTDGEIPEKVFAEITRGDKAWSTSKVEINTTGDVVEVQLTEGQTNVFNVVLFDDKGGVLECEPSSFNIIQGSKIGWATLPYNIGIEVKDKRTGKLLFRTIKGLEKNQSIPAIGTYNGIKTDFPIRPGMGSDFIKIPIYQGEYGSDGTRAIYNDHVYDIIISGNDLPALLPENSDVDLTLNLDKNQQMSIQAYFPYLDHTSEIDIPTDNVQSVETNWLQNEIRKAKGSITELKQGGNHTDEPKLKRVEKEVEQIEKSFQNNKNDVDGKQVVLTNLRKSLKSIDELNTTTEWPKLEEELKEEFYNLEKANNELGNDKSTNQVNQLKGQLEEVIQEKNVKIGNVLLEEIQNLHHTIKESVDVDSVEDLLYELTADEILKSSEFKNYFEELSKIKENKDIDALQIMYKKLKEYA